MRYLLIVTDDGMGKRIPIDEVRATHRGTAGSMISKRPIAVSMVVDDENDDLVLATANGIINRIKVGSVPRRKRASDGRVTKGARILRPDPGDRVVSGAIAPKTTGLAARSPESETVATDRLVFGPRRSLDAISTAGEPALDREAWAATEVHKHSTYRCGHCGAEHPEPHAVYECIAAHVEAARQPELALAA